MQQKHSHRQKCQIRSAENVLKMCEIIQFHFVAFTSIKLSHEERKKNKNWISYLWTSWRTRREQFYRFKWFNSCDEESFDCFFFVWWCHIKCKQSNWIKLIDCAPNFVCTLWSFFSIVSESNGVGWKSALSIILFSMIWWWLFFFYMDNVFYWRTKKNSFLNALWKRG